MKITKIFITALMIFISAVQVVSGQDKRLVERLETHVYTIADDSMAGRKAGLEEARMTAEYIACEFYKIGIQPYFGDTYFQEFNPYPLEGRNKHSCRNVVGIIKGSDPNLRNEYIVVGAHYDHIGIGQSIAGDNIYNGADDNASGVAALIETARKLYEDRASLKRSIIVVGFDAEEIGLHGSRYFVDNFYHPIEDIKLMLSLDMVGWYGVSQVLYYYGMGTLKNGGEAVFSPEAINIGLNVIGEKFDGNPFLTTDTEPFALKGVPALHVTTGTESPYHKPDDEPALIDYSGLVMVTEHVTTVVSHFAREKKITPSGKRSFKHRDRSIGFEFGLVANAGSNFFNYTSGHERGKTAPSYGGGMYTQLNLNWFGVRPEIRYERMGAKNQHGKLWMNSIVVPVGLVFQTPKKYVGGAYVSAGGYYRYAFSGYQAGESLDFSDIYYRNEAGAQWSIGFWLYRVGMAVESRYGISKFLKESGTNPNYKNRTTHFLLYYTF